MTSQSSNIPSHCLYSKCPGCQGTGKTGIVKRPCMICAGKGKLPVSRTDGEGFEKRM